MSKSSTRASKRTDRPGTVEMDPSVVLSVRDLSVNFVTKRGIETALQNVSLDVPRGANLGLVGESGCGKSTFLKAAIGVLAPNAIVPSGRVIHAGVDLLAADPEEARQVRWRDISMITQSALNALDPVHRVGDQIVEAVRAHSKVSRKAAREQAKEMLSIVGVDPNRIDEFPHQFSGGMRQRAIIAMALMLRPELVLADEPTTSLDVIVQDQIFRRVRELQDELGFSMLLVTHDLGLVIENCARIAVMYSGQIVEEGQTSDVVSAPFHPYTLGLKNSLPRLDRDIEPISIHGGPPDPAVQHHGCRFVYRCPFAVDACHTVVPELRPVASGHKAACHRVEDVPGLREKAAQYETWSP